MKKQYGRNGQDFGFFDSRIGCLAAVHVFHIDAAVGALGGDRVGGVFVGQAGANGTAAVALRLQFAADGSACTTACFARLTGWPAQCRSLFGSRRAQLAGFGVAHHDAVGGRAGLGLGGRLGLGCF
jgi:hypothetical protein